MNPAPRTTAGHGPDARPARALRRDGPAAGRPRLRPLRDALAERRAAEDPSAAGPVAVGGPVDVEAVAAEVRPVVARVLSAVAEVTAGRRPTRHLAALCDAAVYRRLADRLGPADRRARLGGIHLCVVSAEAVEVAAVLRGDRRSRAVAARFERDPGSRPADPGTAGRAGPWRVRTLTVL